MTKRDAEHERADAQAMLIARRFLPQESDSRISPLGKGLINDTRLLECRSGQFVLQRINGFVFKDPDAIDTNLLRVQDWLARHPEAEIRMPRLLRDAQGRATLHDDDGGAWRLMEYIGQSRVLKPLQNPRQAHEIGLTLGRFHAALAGLDPNELTLTLPELHDSPRYKANLNSALQSPRRLICGEVAAALDAIEARAALLPVLQRAESDGVLPTKIIHGDPKLDNVLFALESDRALCLIDLDTVQPGLLHHDVADCVRSCCNRANGLDDATPMAALDLDLARALMTGYAEAAASLFDDKMSALLYPAIALIPLELAIRFLTDYLQGDRYFRVTHPRQNLTKARTQLALVADIEAKRDAIETLIGDCFPSAPTTSPRRAGRQRTQRHILEQRSLQERTQAVLEQLADLLAELQHPRADEVRDLARRFAEEPDPVWRALDGNDWWAGAGSLAAETMADNPGLEPQLWALQVRRFRDLLCELAELLQTRGPANPGIGSWLLAFRNWTATGV